jgi:hypothetical protein
MALGAVAFRLIEGVFYALSAACTMILVSLAGQLTAGASTNASADLVRDLRDSAGCVGVLAAYTEATLYYLVSYTGSAQPPHRRAGDGPGGMADRQGVQPDAESEGGGADDERAASSLTAPHESLSTTARRGPTTRSPGANT